MPTNYKSMEYSIISFQEQSDDHEILSILKYVRPGNNFEPKFPLFSKIDVNGQNTDPLFQFLREQLPFPEDNSYKFMSSIKLIIWEPISRTDVSWNFEKFLIDANGRPVKRYSRYFETIEIEDDIERLTQKHTVESKANDCCTKF